MSLNPLSQLITKTKFLSGSKRTDQLTCKALSACQDAIMELGGFFGID